MKLLILTTVDAHKPALLKMLKNASIDSYSSADIKGHKDLDAANLKSNWFASSISNVDSDLLFSFVAASKIENLFSALRDYNNQILDHSPIRAVVVPIEQSL